MLSTHALLKLGEAGDLALEGNDFAVDDEVCRILMKKGFNQFGVFLIEPLTVARIKAQLPAAAEHEAAFSVILLFEQPSLARKALVSECREHRCHPGWLFALSKTLLDIGWEPVQVGRLHDSGSHGFCF